MGVESAADPDKVANKSFATGFRGFDQGEVRAYLTAIGAELRKIRAEQDELLLRLSVAEQKTRTAEELDPKELTLLVGEETTRVLETARNSAHEMRTKAEQSANRMLHEADEEASAARESADRYARETREQADTASRTMRADADAYASDLRTTSEEDAFRTQSDAESYALEARAQADQARAETLADADAYAVRVRGEADTEVEAQRADAHAEVEALWADTHAEVEALRADAVAEADRMRSEASEVLGERTAEAEEAAAAIRAAAEEIRQQGGRDASEAVERGREEGAQLLAEAHAQRDEVTKEIGRRRRQSRQQLEQVSAARERLLEAYATVRSLADDATQELHVALPEARAAAEAVALRDPLDDQPVSAPPAVPTPDRVASGEAAAAAYELGPETDTEVEVDAVEILEAEALGEEDPALVADGDPAAPDADVDALFARLRAGSGGPGAPDAEPVAVPAAPPAINGDAAEANESARNDHNGQNGHNGNGSHPAPEPVVTVDADARATLLEQRDDALEEVEQVLTRRLKRALSDEQNDLLDKVRRTKGPAFDALLGDHDTHRAPYLAVAAEGLESAADAGHRFFATAEGRPGNGTTIVVRTTVDDLAENLADDLVRQLRVRMERCFTESGDEFELTDRIRACYREWKSQRIAEAARNAAFAAFSRGLYDAAPAGAKLCWLVDNGGTPCPDADDNALAGPLLKGESFPTGHTYPPAHAGCRCLTVPAGPDSGA